MRMFDWENYRRLKRIHGGWFIAWTLAIHPVLWYGGAVIISLLGIVLVIVLSPARAQGRSYPTYVETELDKEKRMANRRIAIAYSCGYLEGKTETVDPICEESRETARRHGFRPDMAR